MKDRWVWALVNGKRRLLPQNVAHILAKSPIIKVTPTAAANR